MPAHSDPHGTTPSQTGAGPKKETVRIPLPQPGAGGGKLPPVPPKVARAAAAPEDPERSKRTNPPVPKFPDTIKLPVLPSPSIKINPAPAPAQVAARKAESREQPAATQTSKGWGTLDSWLAFGATAIGAAAISVSLITAEALGHLSSTATTAAHGVLAVGLLTAAGIAAKTLGLWPRSSAQR